MSSDIAWMVAARRKGWISMMLKTKLCSKSLDSTTLWMVPLSVGGGQGVSGGSPTLELGSLPLGRTNPEKTWVGGGLGSHGSGEGHWTGRGEPRTV